MSKRFWIGLASLIALLAFATAANNWWQARVQSVTVAGGGDFVLTASNPIGIGQAALTTGAVQQFHLLADASADGHRIAGALAGAQPSEAVVYGQPVGGTDFVGTLPDPLLARPVLKAKFTRPSTFIGQGACIESLVAVSGARLGMAATLTPESFPLGTSVVGAVRVSASDQVAVRECGIIAGLAPARTIDVAVVQ